MTRSGSSAVKKAAGAAGTVITGIQVAQKVWDAANKDGRLAEAAVQTRDRLAARRAANSPLARLEQHLAAADAAIAEFDPTDDAGRSARERWAGEAATLRSKLTPLRGYHDAKQRKVAVAFMRRADDLLDEIVNYGLEPRRRRSVLPGRARQARTS